MELAYPARGLQYLGAFLLFGVPIFALTCLPSGHRPLWMRPLFAAAWAMLAVGALAGVAAQTILMTGQPLDGDGIQTVLTRTRWGHVLVVRLILVLIAGLAIARKSGLKIQAALAAAILISFVFTGHGGADGLVHGIGDAVHLAAAALWIGALAALTLLTARPTPDLGACLRAFSGLGSGLVTVLVATGLVNWIYTADGATLADALHSAYGVLLLVKIGLFALMLGLAALNRFVLTPRLAQFPAALRLSVTVELAVGLVILALVGIIGMIEPPIRAG